MSVNKENNRENEENRECEECEEKKDKKKLVFIVSLILILLFLIGSITISNSPRDNADKDNKGKIEVEASRIGAVETVDINKDLKDKKVGLEVPAYNTVKNNEFKLFIRNTGDVESLCAIELTNSKTNERELVYEMKNPLNPGEREDITINLKNSKIKPDSVLVSDKYTLKATGLKYSIKIMK